MPYPKPLPPPAERPAGADTPLNNVRVVDFTHFIAGPYATLILADFGAEVIKIENAGSGDAFRNYPPHLQGEGVPYLWANRNKSSVALDLKTDAGREIALALIDQADVVVENFSTGVMERFGLDYPAVSARNPGVVYCSISAYGRSGPYSQRVGFDPIAQAESGFISMNGFPDQEGVRAGPSVMDIATAMMSANAIQAALLARSRTGKGQLVETTLIETAVNMLGNFHMSYLATGVSPTRFGNTQPTAAPVGVFETQDGPIYLAAANDRIFRRLVTEVLGQSDLADHPDYATSAARRENSQVLRDLIGELLRQGTRESWLSRMHAAGVAAGAVRTVAEALDAPEIRSLGLVSEIEHPKLGTVPNVGLPVRFSETPVVSPRAAPLLGADTEEVLRRVLNYDSEQIASLSQLGAFG